MTDKIVFLSQLFMYQKDVYFDLKKVVKVSFSENKVYLEYENNKDPYNRLHCRCLHYGTL
jgi:hypothetical protein